MQSLNKMQAVNDAGGRDRYRFYHDRGPLFDKEKGLVGYTILHTGADSRKTAEVALDKVLADPGEGRSDISYVIATGCGRKRAAFAKEAVTEITCIARASIFSFLTQGLSST